MARLAAGRTTALTAGEIVDVALRQVDDFGLDSLTMGNIAAELNVSQMALYRHFDSKGDLLRAMLDRVWDEAMLIGPLPLEPVEIIISGAMSLWRSFSRHPQIGVLLGAIPEPDQQAENVAMGVELVMTQAGFVPERIGYAYLPIATYMLGAIALQGSRVAAKGPMARVTTEEARRGYAERSSEVGSQILNCMVPTMEEAEAAYERGLRALIAGLLADQRAELGV
jgi:AcrR family transcriptional regulator